jgi:hypothetical protein
MKVAQSCSEIGGEGGRIGAVAESFVSAECHNDHRRCQMRDVLVQNRLVPLIHQVSAGTDGPKVSVDHSGPAAADAPGQQVDWPIPARTDRQRGRPRRHRHRQPNSLRHRCSRRNGRAIHIQRAAARLAQ